MGVSLRCASGRRAAGYADASVLRFAPHWANAHPPHASRSSFWMFYLVFRHIFALSYLVLIIKNLQG
ncbi:MAG: hypothetical protein NZ455_08030 [Bacteroidia bacterium]|nr:hypothetical protein [Bacteroidia bacterium]MDW8345946.1 hypothetical protein [Bacteroidia bacterium]